MAKISLALRACEALNCAALPLTLEHFLTSNLQCSAGAVGHVANVKLLSALFSDLGMFDLPRSGQIASEFLSRRVVASRFTDAIDTDSWYA